MPETFQVEARKSEGVVWNITFAQKNNKVSFIPLSSRHILRVGGSQLKLILTTYDWRDEVYKITTSARNQVTSL